MHILSERFERPKTSCWKHRKHIFSLDEVEQGFFLDRFQLKNIGNHHPAQIVLHLKGSLEFAAIVRLFIFFEVSSSQKTGF